MARPKVLPYSTLMRLTAAQIDWLKKEGERLDRPVSWVMRDILERAMEEEEAQAPQVRRRA